MKKRTMGIRPGKPVRFDGRGMIEISKDRQSITIISENDIEIPEDRDLQSRHHDPAAHTDLTPAE